MATKPLLATCKPPVNEDLCGQVYQFQMERPCLNKTSIQCFQQGVMLEGTFSDYCENYCEVLLTSLVPSHHPHPQSCCCEDVVLPRTAARRGSRPELGWLYNLKPGSGADLVTSPGHWTRQNKATRRGHQTRVARVPGHVATQQQGLVSLKILWRL